MNCKNSITCSDNFCDYLYMLYKNHNIYINNQLLKYNLNLVQVLCIFKISSGENLCQKDLSDEFFLTKGAITKAMTKLVDNGIVTREKSEKDKRQYVLNLTKKGYDLIPILKEINEKWESQMRLNDLSDDFIETFKRISLFSSEIND